MSFMFKAPSHELMLVAEAELCPNEFFIRPLLPFPPL